MDNFAWRIWGINITHFHFISVVPHSQIDEYFVEIFFRLAEKCRADIWKLKHFIFINKALHLRLNIIYDAFWPITKLSGCPCFPLWMLWCKLNRPAHVTWKQHVWVLYVWPGMFYSKQTPVLAMLYHHCPGFNNMMSFTIYN